MSNSSNEENKPQNDDTKKKTSDDTEASKTTEKKALTFKDWKNLKESEKKSNDKSGKGRQNKNTSSNQNSRNSNNFNNNGFNGPNNGFGNQGGGNFFAGNNRMSGCNNFNAMNNFNNNFGNNFGFNNQNGFGFNNFNGPNNFGGNNNFNNGFNNFSNRGNGPNCNLPDNFFATDGIYRQKDLMQKPLPPGANPFRDDQKAQELLEEFNRSRYSKDDKKKKKKGNKKSNDAKKSGDNTNNNDPKIYVPNPKGNIDGKPFIPKPKLPEQNLDICREEKKQQWKEYREAMKPFKNREFYNAKRVVQRLGKLAPSELDEKQLLRLANAREIMAAHKARLTVKYGGSYVKADDGSSELGELYVLEKKPARGNSYPYRTAGKEYQNYGNFGESYCNEEYESGRKILGGYSGYPGFISGGMLEGTSTIN